MSISLLHCTCFSLPLSLPTLYLLYFSFSFLYLVVLTHVSLVLVFYFLQFSRMSTHSHSHTHSRFSKQLRHSYRAKKPLIIESASGEQKRGGENTEERKSSYTTTHSPACEPTNNWEVISGGMGSPTGDTVELQLKNDHRNALDSLNTIRCCNYDKKNSNDFTFRSKL